MGNSKHSASYFQCFTHEQVKKINKNIKENFLKNIKGNFLDKQDPSGGAGNAVKRGGFFHLPCNPLMELIHPWLYQCQLANRVIFGYDIDWAFQLDRLNYNVYEMNDEYTWHIDFTREKIIDMKLTCLLNLSEDPYEGGEFYMINSNEKIEFTSGMGLVLNSLIAHKVTPVTKGERRTLTYWGLGPSWK